MYQILDNSKLLYTYLSLFPEIVEEDVKTILKAKIAENYENNTLGARMINTLIHQYFIKGGFTDKEVKQVTFQKTLKF